MERRSKVRRPKNLSQEFAFLRSRESAPLRRVVTREFNRWFPDGHQSSLRGIFEDVADWKSKNGLFPNGHAFADLNRVSSEALGIILNHGRDYAPHIFDCPLPEPESGGCSYNSWYLAQTASERTTSEGGYGLDIYVEGFAYGPTTVPVLHAWNTISLVSGIAFDWTCYTQSRWMRYLGVPFTLEEYMEITGGEVALIFSSKNFDSGGYRKRLLKVLRRRGEKV